MSRIAARTLSFGQLILRRHQPKTTSSLHDKMQKQAERKIARLPERFTEPEPGPKKTATLAEREKQQQAQRQARLKEEMPLFAELIDQEAD